jgi:RNA polymerase sigma-70 factor (ECF subfamily)
MNKRDDIAAFEQVVKEHHTLVFRTAMGFVHLKEDAEDLTQEVFVRAYRGWSQFRGDAEISTWLYRITINLSLNHISKRNRQHAVLQTDEEALARLNNYAGSRPNPQQVLEALEQRKAIQVAIDALPDKQRTAFVLSKYDDLPQREIASVMRLSEGAVEQLLQRAKANLQKRLWKTIGKRKK